MLVEIIKPNYIFNDERGTLTQLVREGYRQINVIISDENVERGNHYHKCNSEAFYIVSGRLRLVLSKDDKEEEYDFQTGDMFVIQPYVLHSFYYYEKTILVSMYDKGVEMCDGIMDIYKEKDC